MNMGGQITSGKQVHTDKDGLSVYVLWEVCQGSGIVPEALILSLKHGGSGAEVSGAQMLCTENILFSAGQQDTGMLGGIVGNFHCATYFIR